MKISRSAVKGKVIKLVIHGFSEASKLAVRAVVYLTALHNNLETSSNLLVAKSGIAPKDLSIPCKDLVPAQLLTKLMRHVKETLQKVHEIGDCHGWVDSTTVLYTTKEHVPHL